MLHSKSSSDAMEFESPSGSLFLPSCPIRLCRHAFMLLVGIGKTSFFEIRGECVKNQSVISRSHALCGKRKLDANRFLSTAHSTLSDAIDNVAEEFTVQPS